MILKSIQLRIKNRPHEMRILVRNKHFQVLWTKIEQFLKFETQVHIKYDRKDKRGLASEPHEESKEKAFLNHTLCCRKEQRG